jgi:ribosome maturation factor RimP
VWVCDAVIAKSIQAMGYEMLEIEHLARGLLRITIDWPDDYSRASVSTSEIPASVPTAPRMSERMITVDDCEKVTRQLQFVLEVESVAYERLEVGSPGLNRRIYKPSDLDRFAGCLVELTLKEPPATAVQAGILPTLCLSQKKYQGSLETVEAGNAWRIQWTPRSRSASSSPSRPPRSSGKPSKKRNESTQINCPQYALPFVWTDVHEARLVPDIDFSRPRRKSYES